MTPKKHKLRSESSKASTLVISSAEETNEQGVEPKQRTINIYLEHYQHIKPFFPIADIQANIQYGDNILGFTDPIPILDDDVIPINVNFCFTVDVNNPRELDALISTPATILIDQIEGTMDKKFYDQMQINSELHTIPPAKSFDTIVSMYEALNTKKIELTEEVSQKKRKKKESEKAAKSVKSNKSRKDSSNDKGSIKSRMSSNIEMEPTAFGMCCLDFLPLFYGKKTFTQALLIKPLVELNDNKMLSFKAHPNIVVTVSTEEGLELIEPTFLNFTLETVYNLPNFMAEGMDYWVCTMLPMLNGKKAPLLFTNPTIVTKTEAGSTKLWPGTARAHKDANTTLYQTPLDTKDIICNFDPNIENYINADSPRLEFVMIKRHLMLKDAVTELINHIRVYRKIVLEMYVAPVEKNKKKSANFTGKSLDFSAKKAGKAGQNLHLMAMLDAAVLLYPGVQDVRVAVPLTTFSLEEAAKYGGLEDSFFVPSPKKDAKEKNGREKDEKEATSTSKKDKSSKSSKSSKEKTKETMKELLPKPTPPMVSEASQQIFNEEGKPCFVLIAIELSNALVATRSIEDLKDALALLLGEQQGKGSLDTKCLLTSCMSFDYYHELLGAMISDLNKKFVTFMTENLSALTEIQNSEQTTARFIMFLQNEGIYESYVAAITKAASLLVSKQFMLSNEKNKLDFQNFVGDVYVFLVSKMNTTVNTLMCHGMEPTNVSKKTDAFFFYAKEASDTERLEMAERYFLERICNDTTKAEYWFDYGIYLLEKREEDQAYECMKEALLQQNHKYSLLVLAMLLCNRGQKEDAETCFLKLMTDETTWAEGWAILYLFYQKIEKYEGMDKSIGMARKYAKLSQPPNYFEEYDELIWTTKICPQTVFFRAAMLLLKLRSFDWSELALAQEITTNAGLVNYLLSAICFYKKLYNHAMDHIGETLKYYGPDYAVASLAGHCLLALNKKEEAKKHYKYALTFFNRPAHLHLVSVQMAKICEHFEEYQEARQIILLACKYNPSPYSWFLAGKFYYLQNDLMSAEECFSEGNTMDNRYADIWGYLAVVNFKLGRQNEAELCFEQAIKNQLSDESLLELIQDVKSSSSALNLY